MLLKQNAPALNRFVSWHPEPEAVAISVFYLLWNSNYFSKFPPFSLVGRVTQDPQRQGKCSDSCTRLVNPTLVHGVATDDPRGLILFSAVTKKFGIATQTLREQSAMQRTTVNSNQGNNTPEKSLRNIS